MSSTEAADVAASLASDVVAAMSWRHCTLLHTYIPVPRRTPVTRCRRMGSSRCTCSSTVVAAATRSWIHRRVPVGRADYRPACETFVSGSHVELEMSGRLLGTSFAKVSLHIANGLRSLSQYSTPPFLAVLKCILRRHFQQGSHVAARRASTRG